MVQQRFFNPHQRLAAYAAEHGQCAICGQPLLPGFHADHIVAAARGGQTDVMNAAALCPRCNQVKGAKPAVMQIGAKPAVMKPAVMKKGASLDPQSFDPQSFAHQAFPHEALDTRHRILHKALDANEETLEKALDGREKALDEPLPVPAWNIPLRAWQEQGLLDWRRLRAEGRRDVLVTATPGAGKSLLAARICHEELTAGRVDRLVIAVPSQVLKRQWAAVAQSVGIRLAASWGNDSVVLPPDVHGVIVTYAQIARLPEAVRIHCGRHRMLAVLDEIHHGADGRSWGNGIREALENAQARLCLSGTAWRGDAATIPFVRYDPQGRSLADVDYSYAKALADRAVREVYFFTHGGQVKWLDGRGEHDVTFAQKLDPEGLARRLRAALDVSGGWLEQVLQQASGALEAVRVTHPEAKGLIVCMDGSHARAVAALAHRITGEKPVLALSDDPDAAEALSAFRTGKARWLVVCKMAGEGYDCPDLRVCLWASNVLSELYFRQVIGRTIRMVPGLGYQDGQVFLPSDPRLLAMARSILAQRVQALGGPQQDREERVRGTESGGGESGRGRSLFVPLASQAAGGAVVTGGSTIPPEALRRAEAFRSAKPGLAHLPPHFIAAIFSHLEPHQWPEGGSAPAGAIPAAAIPAADEAGIPKADEAKMAEVGEAIIQGTNYVKGASYDDLRLEKRRVCSRLAAALARVLGVQIEEIHRECHQALGVRQSEAGLADLQRKEEMLKQRLLQRSSAS